MSFMREGPVMPLLYLNFAEMTLVCADEEMYSFLREQYESQRYLSQVTESSLLKRLDGLVTNLMTLSLTRAPVLLVKSGKQEVAFIDLLTELSLRGINIMPHLEKSVRRFEDYKGIANTVDLFGKSRALAGEKCLFKFTKLEFVDDLRHGRIRFTLASSYKRSGYNVAIRDDELNIQQQLLNLKVTLADGSEAPVRNGVFDRNACGDYYVSCFSVAIDLKLFHLFDADACFIVRDGDRFVQEVQSAYREQYEDSRILFGSVDYVDPYRELKTYKSIQFLKTDDFAYEKEFRFVAFDGNPQKEDVRPLSIDMSKIRWDLVINE